MSLEVLDLYGLPTKSPARAVQEFLAREYDIHKTNGLILALDEKATPIGDLQTAHYTCGYMIEQVVKADDTAVAQHPFAAALERAEALKARLPHVAHMYSGAPLHRIDEDGNIIETKRGSASTSALEQARELITARKAAGANVDRNEMVDLFVSELGIARTTASSYYWAVTKDDTVVSTDPVTGTTTTTKPPRQPRAKKNGGESRREQIQRVFSSRPSWKDRAEFLDAVVAETGCSRAAANTFSYTVMPSAKPKAARA